MLKELKDSFIGEVEKRFKNPFLGALLLSWIFWNWDFLYVALFLDEQYVSKIPELLIETGKQVQETLIYKTKYEYLHSLKIINIEQFVLFPLLSAFGLIVFVELITTQFNIFIKILKNKIQKFDLLTVDESNEIKNSFVKFREESRNKVNLQNESILSLNSQLDQLNLDINKKAKKISEEKVQDRDKRIKELEKELENSMRISNDRLQTLETNANQIEDLNHYINELGETNNRLTNELNNHQYSDKGKIIIKELKNLGAKAMLTLSIKGSDITSDGKAINFHFKTKFALNSFSTKENLSLTKKALSNLGFKLGNITGGKEKTSR